MNMFSRFMTDESGATAIEYGLIAAIVAVGIIAALQKVSGSLQTTFNSVSDSLSGTSTGGGGGGTD
jgi:pilus assembly protein Flp/PilA